MQAILAELVPPVDIQGTETAERGVSSRDGERPFAEHLREETRGADRAAFAEAEAEPRRKQHADSAPREATYATPDDPPEAPADQAAPGSASASEFEAGPPEQAADPSNHPFDLSGQAAGMVENAGPGIHGGSGTGTAEAALAFGPGDLQAQIATGLGAQISAAATTQGIPRTGGASQQALAKQMPSNGAAPPAGLAAGLEPGPQLAASPDGAATTPTLSVAEGSAADLAWKIPASPGQVQPAPGRLAVESHGLSTANEGQARDPVTLASRPDASAARPATVQPGKSKTTASAVPQTNTQTPDSPVQTAAALTSAKWRAASGAALPGSGGAVSAASAGAMDLAGGPTAGAQASILFVPTAGMISGQLAAGTLPGAGSQAPTAPVQQPAEQVVLGIHKAVGQGREHISLKLYPAELGRIDVRVELADDGVLRAVITADKSDTLELLQRDARGLERALQEAGLKTDSGSLSFDLRGDGYEANDTDETQPHETESGGAGHLEDGEALIAHSRLSVHHGLLDLSV